MRGCRGNPHRSLTYILRHQELGQTTGFREPDAQCLLGVPSSFPVLFCAGQNHYARRQIGYLAQRPLHHAPTHLRGRILVTAQDSKRPGAGKLSITTSNPSTSPSPPRNRAISCLTKSSIWASADSPTSWKTTLSIPVHFASRALIRARPLPLLGRSFDRVALPFFLLRLLESRPQVRHLQRFKRLNRRYNAI